MNWLLPALLTPFFWGVSNIFNRILTTKHVKPINLMVVGGFFWLVNLFFLPLTNFKLLGKGIILLGMFIGMIRIFTYLYYLKALEIEEASRVTPLFNVASLFVLILSSVFLNEQLTQYQLIAFFLMLSGAFLLSIKRVEGLFKVSKAVWFIFINTSTWAVSVILLKYVYRFVTLWDAIVLMAVGELIFVGFILLFNKKLRKDIIKQAKGYNKKVWLLILGSNVLGLTGGLLSSLAFQLGPASLVSVVGGFEGVLVFVVTIFLSKYFPRILKEDINRNVLITKGVAIMMMIVGIYFINR